MKYTHGHRANSTRSLPRAAPASGGCACGRSSPAAAAAWALRPGPASSAQARIADGTRPAHTRQERPLLSPILKKRRLRPFENHRTKHTFAPAIIFIIRTSGPHASARGKVPSLARAATAAFTRATGSALATPTSSTLKGTVPGAHMRIHTSPDLKHIILTIVLLTWRVISSAYLTHALATAAVAAAAHSRHRLSSAYPHSIGGLDHSRPLCAAAATSELLRIPPRHATLNSRLHRRPPHTLFARHTYTPPCRMHTPPPHKHKPSRPLHPAVRACRSPPGPFTQPRSCWMSEPTRSSSCCG